MENDIRIKSAILYKQPVIATLMFRSSEHSSTTFVQPNSHGQDRFVVDVQKLKTQSLKAAETMA